MQAARDLGCSPHYIGRVLNGRARPSADFVARFAAYVGIDAIDLFVEHSDDIIVAFVRRTTRSSGVPELLEDEAIVEQVARNLRGDAA
jgi:transcriptional regulator with XRE-family HTH domain